MQKVRPDSGALIFWELFKENKMIKFVNGMAANDPVSTLQIWYQISERFQTQTHTCIFFNSRDDRPDRTRQMIELTMNDIKPNYFIIRGDKIDQLIKKEKVNSPKTEVETIPLNLRYESVVEKILELPKDTLVFAIGNQVGAGQSILEKISAFRRND